MADDVLRISVDSCLRHSGEIEERAKYFESLFDNIPDPILVATLDGRLIDANPPACLLLGHERHELIEMYPWDFVQDASRGDILSLIQDMQPQVPVSVQQIYCNKRGTRMHMALRLVRCTLAGQERIIVSCRDITEQKAVEDRLKESERNLAEGQHLTKTGSWILHYWSGNTKWSVETCRIFGFPDPPPSPHYSEFLERVAAEHRQTVDSGLRESAETGEPRPLKYVFELPDGTRKDIETIAQPVKDGAGKVLHLMGTVMDVTERQCREDALRASEVFARGQFNSLTRALDALAAECELDRFVYHVFRSITRELDAHSVSAWLFDRSTHLMHYEYAFENDRLVDDSDAGIAAVSPPLRVEEVVPWPEIFRTRRMSVLLDIREGPSFPWRERLVSLGVVTVAVAPLLVAGEVEGAIGIRFSRRRELSSGEQELVQAFANQAMLAIQLRRLSAQSRQATVAAERNRFARDIHDTLAQGFTGVIAQLEAGLGALALSEHNGAEQHVRRAMDLARSCLREARRSVHALRNQSLIEGSLRSTLNELFHLMASGTHLQIDFVVVGEPYAVSPAIEEALLHIAQEGLTNTMKHAEARLFVARLRYEAEALWMQMIDDGCGFDPDADPNGYGLMGIKERVEEFGGHLIVRSVSGQGTELEMALPNVRLDTTHEGGLHAG